MAHAYYSWLLINTERFEQGLTEAREALRLDPENSFIAFAGGLGFMFARQFQRGIDTLRAGIAVNPGFYILHWLLGEIYAVNGQFDEALAALEKAVELSGRSPFIVGSLGVAYQRCGYRDRADVILHELARRAEREHVPESSFFLMHMVRGNLAEALRWLERAGAAHDSYLSWIRGWPWEGVRARGEGAISARAKKAFVRFLVGRIIRRHRIVES
jgi:Flp pilus assembly protein TadD